MSKLYIDFETKDHGIEQGLGAGWPYKGKVKVIGYAYAIDDAPVFWSTDLNKLKILVESCDEIICHNASYDVGIITMLGIDSSNKRVIDTIVLAKLYDNSLLSYSLDNLGKKYLGENKTDEDFIPIAWELKLVKAKTQNAIKYAKANLDKVFEAYPQVVVNYAKQDVELLRKLYLKYHNNESFYGEHDWDFYSDLIKCVIDIRKRGVRVDVQQIYKSIEIIENDLFKVNNRLSVYLQGRNPNSTPQLAQICDELGISYPKTDKGNPSITAKWIEAQEGEFFEALQTYKKLNKLLNDFLKKSITQIAAAEGIEEEHVKYLKYSRLHPEINIMGAIATGRFSGTNPNIQQQPKRDDYARPLIRSMFIPEKGEQWYCADFSAQEPRLQVHYASLIRSKGGLKMAQDWRNNPDYDMHTEVATLCGIDRKAAKTINLGLSYGMGLGKLSRSLNLNMKQSSLLVKKYHMGAPYLKDLTEATKRQLSNKLFIKTALGRKLRKDADSIDDDGRIQDFLYKGINKLIQGSAADQTMAAMVLAYRHGVTINFPVHDEITISTASLIDVVKLKFIMENAFKLLVPSKSEVTCGNNFADQEEVDLTLGQNELFLFVEFKKKFKPIKAWE